MNYFFISSMARSGSTLLDKLLCNHEDLSVLSQPFPLLFVELKKIFHEKINHPEKYYVLNNYFVEQRYRPSDFYNFLKNYQIPKAVLYNIFEKMKDYSGQYTKINNLENILRDLENRTFIQIIKILLKRMSNKKSVKYFASKEIYSEEFLPFLLNNKFKGIIIIRDPRDVITSIYYGKGNIYTGDNYPLLFNIRNWRKSADFAIHIENNHDFLLIKYENLVNNPFKILNRITNFLNVNKFSKDIFKHGIKDQNNEIWKNNSSFNLDKVISSRSVNRYRNKLSKDITKFIEYTCMPEMKYLKYEMDYNINSNIIDYLEDFNINRDEFIKNYSSCKENIYLENRRHNIIFNNIEDNNEINLFYIFSDVYEKIKRKIL